MGAVPVAVFENLPGAVRDELSRRGIELQQLAGLVDLHAGEPLLLAGSYATGEANPTSDLDLLVLTEDDGNRAPAGSSNHPSIFGDSFDIQLAGLTVNLEYVPQSRFLDLCQTVAATRPPGAGPQVGNFQALELRLAQRITTGIALVGAERAEHLRQRLDFEAVRASASALDFVMAMSLLEDTQVLSPPAQTLMLHGAGELLVRAAINAVGPITYDSKHIFRRAPRLAGHTDAPTALAAAEQLVFVDRLPIAEAVELVLDHAEDLHRRLLADPRQQVIVQMLEPFLPGWAWSGRTFGAA
jgi:hypothetical protein